MVAAARPGTAARSHVGQPRPGASGAQPPPGRGDPPLGRAQRSRAAGHGVRPLSQPSASRRAAQAVDALRHGWPIALACGPVLLPAETAVAADAAAVQMLISAARAETLKLVNQREAAEPHAPVLVRGAEPFDLSAARALADPALDLATPLKGPFKAEPLDWISGASAALELARIAGILPAFLVDPRHAGEAQPFAPDDLRALADPARLTVAARARLPVSASEECEIVAFRSADDLREHVALVFGRARSDRAPLVRLHSECLTGDVLGSLKCDCGPQLDAALHAAAGEARSGGWGVVLYLRQEGRGIGLINKLRAYRLQDQGFDTVDANQRLGLPDDARDFPVAARMLDLLGARSIRLMTNNPAKVAALEAAGVSVTERVPHQLPDNPHNARYLATKRDRSGHLLG
ncbi:GTP cyclohydrolase II [Parafrankia sp. BMG5.11]|nr:GTP cyclohydrolase II [Parafrankia sp. BMG5.11]